MFMKEINIRKIIAVCLIFCFVFANSFTLFSNIALAKNNEIGKQYSENTSNNVEYDVKFVKENEEQGYECEESIDEENLNLKIDLEIKKEGYLKNSKILIEAENGLSFDIEEKNEEKYKVIENTIELSNISSDEKLEILLPIKYKEREDIQNLNKKINAKLIGTYVNKTGSEKNISETVILNLIWNTNTEFNLNTELKKYIPYASENKNGAIIQTSIKSQIPTKNAFVNKEEIEVEALKIDGYEIEKVYVTSKSDLSETEWNYNKEIGKINIKIEKETETIKSEEFLITYIFLGEKEVEVPFKASTKMNGSIFMFGNNEKSEAQLEAEYEINEKLGDIITVEASSEENIKIGNLLSNKIGEEKTYKLNYDINIASDISSNKLVEGILIKDAGEEFENENGRFVTNTSYYNSVKISKENFEKILGSDGRIEILNSNKEIISKIDRNANIDNENNYIVNLKENKINIKTTKPINEGILLLTLNKEMVDSEYSVEDLKTFSKLNSKYIGSIIYSESVENVVSNTETKINLEKPQTKAEMKISRKTLSTIAENNDIEMTIELNNTNEDIDLYKNPSFNIVFPEYVENVEITNLAIANSEEVFEIKENKLYINEQGKIALDIKLEGTQEKYNSNNIVNGTNIIINANIKLNIYAPSKQEKIIFNYTNENATTYENEVNGVGYSETEIAYKAPVGVVSINQISNYDKVGSSILSVEQGKVTDKIEIFDEAKTATMDILVMNNKENKTSDIKILGRIPFKGNKNVKTGEDLGTTVDTKLVNKISEDSQNKANAKIYYSENGNATQELEKAENGWMSDVADFSKIKSYLIVLENYEMNPGEVLKYTYQYEIPENLEHNNNIYGSFETMYKNLSDVATTSETSTPDIVGLTTGVGPQMNVKLTTNIKEKAKEYEKVKYTTTIENTGSEIAENVVLNTKIPTGASLAVYNTENTLEEEKGWSLENNREIKTNIGKINPGETKKIEFFVQVNKLPSIEEYYSNTQGFTKNDDGTYSINKEYIDENGETKYKEEKISGIPEVKLVCESTITANELSKAIKVQDTGIIVEKSNLVAEEIVKAEESIAKVNETIESNIQVRNNSKETMRNIIVTKVLPEGLNYSESYIRGYEEDGITIKKINTSNYDVTTKTITWKIEELKPGQTAIAIGKLVVGEMKDKVYKDTISTISNIQVNNEQYQAGQVDITIGRPNLEINQTSNKTNQYVKVGDEIEYIFKIKNTGSVKASNVVFADKLPEEVKINKLAYTVDGIEVAKVVSKNEDATVYTSILPENELEVKIKAKIGDINSKQKTIENEAEVKATTIEKIDSNKVVNIIERTNATNSNSASNSEKQEQNSNINNSSNQEVKTKYEIKGTAWLDKNKNGSRDSGEEKLSGIEVKLINPVTGEQIDKTVTTVDGEYTFANLVNGAYMAIFYYDNSRYALTDYKKQGIEENKNSDVISATESDRNVATTDIITINNGSISNIDIGLIEATKFDLSLTKSITKVTVQTSKETKSYDFDSTDLAKVDINAKYISGAKVLVEYKFTVKNEGELEGYAKKIVDYLPKELEFNTELNKNWYKGNDENLYTDELANSAIAAGESKEIKLVLTKNMTETNTGIINNQAEIAESYNKAGIADYDSQSNDRDPKDDDMSSADLIIGVKTGESLIYLSTLIGIAILGIVAAIVIQRTKIILKLKIKFGKEA